MASPHRRQMTAVSSGPARCPVTFAHHDPAMSVDPYLAYDRVRGEAGPVAWSDTWGGYWVVTGYAEVRFAAQRDDIFVSRDGVAIPQGGNPFPSIPIQSDSPDTKRY